MKVRFLEAALAEFEEAAEYYRSISSVLGVRFAREFDGAIEKIVDRPTLRPFVREPYRRCLLRKFRYGVIYRFDEIELVIIAFTHLSRDPDYWKSRE